MRFTKFLFIFTLLASLRLNACIIPLSAASFLIQHQYPNSADPVFLEGMARAIETIKEEILSKKHFTEIDIERWLDLLAEARQKIAYSKNLPHAGLYGLRMPRSQAEVEDFESILRQWWKANSKAAVYDPATDSFYVEAAEAMYFFNNPNINLVALIKSTGRHQAYLQDALERAQIPSVNSSVRILKISPHEVKILHPIFKTQWFYRNKAVSILLDSLNRPSGGEATLNSLAQFSFYMMSAPPFFMGSPSIVESLNQAVLLGLHGQGFNGQKTYEPFWKIVFWKNKPEEFNAPTFLSCFTR